MPSDLEIKEESEKNVEKNFFNKNKMTLIGSMDNYVVGASFTEYEMRLQQFFIVNGVSEEVKVPFFITLIGADAFTILRKMCAPIDPSKKKYEELVKILKEYFDPPINEIAESYKFYQIEQQDSTLVEYILKLKAAADSCNFGQFLERALRDKFVCGLRDKGIRAKLLKEGKLTFEKACETALAWESADNVNQKIISKVPNSNVNQVKGHQVKNYQVKSGHVKNNFQNTSFNKNKCYRCGRQHNPNTCPARNWECFKCKKKGHISTQCRSTKSDIKVIEEMSKAISDIKILSEKVKVVNEQSSAVVVPVEIEGVVIEMELDSGACVSVVSEDEYLNKLSKYSLIDSNKKLLSVLGEDVKCIGKIMVPVYNKCKNKVENFELFITKNAIQSLMGRTWLDSLYPTWRQNFLNSPIKSINNSKVSEINCEILSEIKSKFPKIFHIKNAEFIEEFRANIVLKEDSPVIFHKPYTVPFRLRDQVKQELSRMCEVGILKPVKYSRFASPIVVVPKSDNSLRICIDCKVTINRYVNDEYYPLPRCDDIFASMSNCSYFCKIDLKGAYLQLKLSEQSREYVTINTINGLYQYTCLPFGLKSAPSIFQSVMDQILSGLDNVKPYLDDILIGAKSRENCKQLLFKVLSRLNKYNVKINLEKCSFMGQEIKFLGHIISYKGLHPDMEKVEAIKRAPAPKNKTELQSYIGLINYYRNFIPNLSSKLKILYDLLCKNTPFTWNEEHNACFEKSKTFLNQFNILEIYDPNKEIVLICDASPYGVGAVMAHRINNDEKPIIFISSTLSAAEKNYAQVHREALAVIFSVQKLYKYLYGNKFEIITDNQAVCEIFNPKKSTSHLTSSRLQKWATYLSIFNYSIKYRPGKINVADGLSRLPISKTTEVEYIRLLSDACETFINKELVKKHLEQGTILQNVFNFVKEGWPKSLDRKYHIYFQKRKDLTIDDGYLYYRERLVIPFSLQQQVLELLHQNHEGIVRMKMMGRSIVWWYNFDKNVENFVKYCHVCQITQNHTKEVITTSWPETTFPFERVHLDFFQILNKTFIILVDSYSKYVDAKAMSKTDAPAVCKYLRRLFRDFGNFKEIVSDNGPPYNSTVFIKFLENRGIKVSKSPFYHPPSNGSAERGVETLKNIIKKHMLDEKLKSMEIDAWLDQILMAYNNYPSTVTKMSPLNMILSYTPITEINSLLKNIIVNEKKNKYKVGDIVKYKLHYKDFAKWKIAKILKVISKLTYLVDVDKSVKFVHENQLAPYYQKPFFNLQLPLPQNIENQKSDKNDKVKYYKNKNNDTNIIVRRSERLKSTNKKTGEDVKY